MRRRSEITLQVALTAAEREAIGLIRAAGGFDSDSNAVRCALWSLGDHMGLDFADGVFDLRKRGPDSQISREPNPKISQKELSA